MTKPDTTARCHCGARCVAYGTLVETYRLRNQMPALGRIPMHWVVQCERGHRQDQQPAHLSLLEVET